MVKVKKAMAVPEFIEMESRIEKGATVAGDTRRCGQYLRRREGLLYRAGKGVLSEGLLWRRGGVCACVCVISLCDL